MTATELYRQGRLNDAIQALGAELRDNPTDQKKRTFLFELLCFAGEFDRAEKHLDVLASSGMDAATGGLLYRAAIAAERSRNDLFTKKDYPVTAAEPVTGTLNGKPFEALEDSDPRIGPRLEIFAGGQYMWVPFAHIASIQMQPPKRLRDLLWAPCLLHTGPQLKAMELGEVLVPVLAPFSFKHADDTVRLGRATVWEEQEGGDPVPFGQRTLIVDGEEFPFLELRNLEIAGVEAARKAMPLRNDLLNPISSDQPAGENLYYSPTYDKIKEARREELEAPQGEWKRERKLADWPVVVKLAGEALATKTKDLQLAVWLAEAMLRREGVTALRDSINLIREYLLNFWDGLYPEIEDGDADFRATPLRWFGEKNEKREIVVALKSSPITKGGYSWLKFIESREVGDEASVADSYEKQGKRNALINEGKIPAEVFDKDFESTPKKYYADLEQAFDQTLEALAQLTEVSDEKFGDDGPSYRFLQENLEEVRQTVHILLQKKREKEPDVVVAAPEPEPEPEQDYAPPVEDIPVAVAAAAPAPKAAPRALTLEPQSPEDAINRIVVAAKYLRQQDAYNPAPFLILRGLRWGELRASGSSVDQMKLAAPPSEIRQTLKRASIEGNWADVLEAAETAMGMECGRGWLDLQRYAVRACSELGYYYQPIANGILAELKGLLAEYPQLPEFTMLDDTPTANAETTAWLKESVLPPPPVEAAPAIPEPEPEPAWSPPPVYQTAAGAAAAPEPEPDAYDLAMRSVRAGRPQEGIELLMREMMQEPSGRGRFQRRVQVAQLCLGMGNEAIALPILQEAASEIERRKLEEWETRELVAHTLAMLYKCLAKNNTAPEERQKLYSWICRLDPIEAMNVAR